MCGIEWRPVEAPVRSASDGPGTWIVAAEDDQTGRQLVEALRQSGADASLCTPDEDALTLAKRLGRRPGEEPGIVVLDWTLEPSGDDEHLASRSQSWLAELTEELADPQSAPGPRWWITRDDYGAKASGAEASSAKGSDSEGPFSVTRRWGTPPCAEGEDARWVRVDLGTADPGRACSGLVSALGAATRESHLAMRDDGWLAARLVHLDPRPDPASAAAELTPASGCDFVARVVDTDAFDPIVLEECEPPSPGPNEVVVEVEAAGLSFLDVLSALGVGAEVDAAAVGVGREMAGRIVALGPRDDAVGRELTTDPGLRIGDRVFGFASDAVARRVVTSVDLVAVIPAGLDSSQAAGLPLAHCAALYALRDVARVKKGDSVLIHSATGGIGLAAIAIARELGARVLATAGDESRRERLRSLGVEHVAESRSAGGVDEILRATGGAGVDVILDTSQREAADEGLALLAPGGRFVDLNPLNHKRSAQASEPHFPRLGENRAFLTLDFDALLRSQPRLVAALLREITASVASEKLDPCATSVFPVAELGRAVRYLVQARHVGKVVVSLEGAEHVLIRHTLRETSRLSPDASYAISGLEGERANRLRGWMLEQGAGSVEIVARGGLGACARRAAGSGRALRGVVHVEPFAPSAAAPNLRETESDLDAVGAGSDLDFLLLVSPSHSWIGVHPRETGTRPRIDAAALAQRQRALGQSALHVVIAGEWNDENLLAGIDRALGHVSEHASVVSLADDFAQWAGDRVSLPILCELRLAEDDGSSGASYRDALALLPRQERIARLREIVLDGLSGVLGLGGAERSKLDARAPLEDLGLDSLMTLELYLGLTSDLGFEAPPAGLADARSVADIAVVMADEIDDAHKGANA
jgi:NADPH:quinone reductase-like Zn-dependent oxidoreductase/acyl carrier protein